MERTLLTSDVLQEFLTVLSAFGEVHGPILTDDGVSAFGLVQAAADLCLDYSRTLIPPKKYLLHPRDTVLALLPDQGYIAPEPHAPEIVLIGLHPCDLQGIAYLDAVFMHTVEDPLYCARRKAMTLVGLACKPDDYCFCGDSADDDSMICDLAMRPSPPGFILTGHTDKGLHIISRLAPFLSEGEPAPTGVPGCSTMLDTIRQASNRGETFPESHLWEDFARRCFSCGACSLCCPTCYCFDLREYGTLDGAAAVRLREWDNCLFKGHGEVAGGINFRRTRLERFQYRYQHKYLGFGPTRGMLACVGCGRCREVCPVKIDLLELFEEGEKHVRP